MREAIELAKLGMKSGLLAAKAMAERPFLCNWQITYRCTFKCKTCLFWREAHSAQSELTLDEIARAADTLRPLAPLLISMAGGEPLLREDLPEITRILSRDHIFTLITNGWLVTPSLARDLYLAGLKHIHVSIDYANAERHDAMRGREGAFARALQAVEILRDSRPSRWHRVHIMTVVLEDNLDDLEPLAMLARDLGVSLELSLYSNRGGKKPALGPKGPVAERLGSLKRRYPDQLVSLDGYLEAFDAAPSARPRCNAGSTYLNVTDRGEVSRCIDRHDEPVGSLLDDSADDLLARLRSQATASPCTSCWTSCRGLGDIVVGPVGFARSLPQLSKAAGPM